MKARSEDYVTWHQKPLRGSMKGRHLPTCLHDMFCGPSLLMYRSSGLGNSPLNVFHSSSPLAGVEHRVSLASELTCQHLFFFKISLFTLLQGSNAQNISFFFFLLKRNAKKMDLSIGDLWTFEGRSSHLWFSHEDIKKHVHESRLTCNL